jgi:excisionase family DNA binding protein
MSALDTLVAELADAVADRLAERLAAPSSEPGTPWRNAEQAAAYLGDAPVSRIYDLVQSGALQPHRDGRRLLFHTDDLDAYVESENE